VSTDLDSRENISISNDIEALRNAVQDNHVVTQDFLRRIETDVNTAGCAVKLESALLTEISTAIEQQRAMTSSSHALIQSTSAMLSVKLDSVVRALILHSYDPPHVPCRMELTPT
jgi:hypothetical protein